MSRRVGEMPQIMAQNKQVVSLSRKLIVGWLGSRRQREGQAELKYPEKETMRELVLQQDRNSLSLSCKPCSRCAMKVQEIY